MKNIYKHPTDCYSENNCSIFLYRQHDKKVLL